MAAGNIYKTCVNLLESFLAYADAHRARIRLFAGALSLLIAFVDWLEPDVSLGFLFIIPILLASGQMKGIQMAAAALSCAVLRETFGPLEWGSGAALRIVVAFTGFLLAGFFVSELNRKRRLVLASLQELQEQVRLRHTAEQQVRTLVETSPLAILTIDHTCRVLLANRSAEELLGSADSPVEGSDVRPILPILGRILKVERHMGFRTTVESQAQRSNGEPFLAHIWLSTFVTPAGPGLAAVIWDASENLRDREAANLDSMMATSRVLIGAVSHEIRNLACAALLAHRELAWLPDVADSESYRALGSILLGLDKITTSGLSLGMQAEAPVAELGTVLDEARVVIEPGIREDGGAMVWRVAGGLPLVQADQHGLLQVFLNLARNSQRAIAGSARRELVVEASQERDLVVVRFRDTGSGVSNPADLFKPFQSGESSTGLGLYVSRAILRAHGGDLKYEPQSSGSCFAVELWPANNS